MLLKKLIDNKKNNELKQNKYFIQHMNPLFDLNLMYIRMGTLIT